MNTQLTNIKTDELRDLYTVKEVSKMLHISIYSLRPILKHIIKPKRIGLSYIITKSDIERIKLLLTST